LIQIHADKSATGNLNLKAKDIENFEQIAQLLSQERDKKERQFH